jgi:hypothetical protein
MVMKAVTNISMLQYTIFLKGQAQPVHVQADSFEFNCNARNADGREANFQLEQSQGSAAPSNLTND